MGGGLAHCPPPYIRHCINWWGISIPNVEVYNTVYNCSKVYSSNGHFTTVRSWIWQYQKLHRHVDVSCDSFKGRCGFFVLPSRGGPVAALTAPYLRPWNYIISHLPIKKAQWNNKGDDVTPYTVERKWHQSAVMTEPRRLGAQYACARLSACMMVYVVLTAYLLIPHIYKSFARRYEPCFNFLKRLWLIIQREKDHVCVRVFVNG